MSIRPLYKQKCPFVHWTYRNVHWTFKCSFVHWTTRTVHWTFKCPFVHWTNRNVHWTFKRPFVHWKNRNVHWTFNCLFVHWTNRNVHWTFKCPFVQWTNGHFLIANTPIHMRSDSVRLRHYSFLGIVNVTCPLDVNKCPFVHCTNRNVHSSIGGT